MEIPLVSHEHHAGRPVRPERKRAFSAPSQERLPENGMRTFNQGTAAAKHMAAHATVCRAGKGWLSGVGKVSGEGEKRPECVGSAGRPPRLSARQGWQRQVRNRRRSGRGHGGIAAVPGPMQAAGPDGAPGRGGLSRAGEWMAPERWFLLCPMGAASGRAGGRGQRPGRGGPSVRCSSRGPAPAQGGPNRRGPRKPPPPAEFASSGP